MRNPETDIFVSLHRLFIRSENLNTCFVEVGMNYPKKLESGSKLPSDVLFNGQNWKPT